MKKLNQDYKAVTVLMFLIICVGVIVSASLLQHSGSKNSFSVNIVSPTGGEAWQGNTTYTISYTLSGGRPDYTVELYYTTDNGTFFTFIDYHNQTREGTYPYPWTTPLITNEAVKIMVNVTESGSESASDMSENFFEIDSTPPGTIILSVVDNIKDYGSPSSSSVMLTWTAPGDDDDTGTAATYDIRYLEDVEVTDANWDSATSCSNVPAPKAARSSESFTVTGLTDNKTYFFAIKTYDNVGFFSISNSPSITTLYFETWGEKTIAGTQSFSDTEIWLNGNLEIYGSLTFDRVLLRIQSQLDLRYGIHVRPNGYFHVNKSMITSYWTDPAHPYWILVSARVIEISGIVEKGEFWLVDSSVHYCGGKVEDVSADIGLEIYSDDVRIIRSTISNSWGVYIRPPSGASAECPLITDNLLTNNTVGIYAGSRDYPPPDIPGLPDLPELPDISFLDQIPINLIHNTFSYNGIGVYSNGARLKLEKCDLLYNNYGAVYNNTPTDYPGNVSGVVYHCRFEHNDIAIKSDGTYTNLSFLKLITSVLVENTEAIRCNKSSLNIICESVISDNFLGVNSTLSSIIVRNSDIINNTKAADSYNDTYQTYFVYNKTYNAGMFGGIYCKGSSLIIENSNISNNLNGITLFLTSVNISNSILMQNQYIIIDDETGRPLKDSYGNIIWDGWGVYSEGSVTMNILGSNITHNEYGIISIFSFLNVANNNISYNGDDVSNYGIALLWAYGEANITNNTFFGNDIAMLALGSVEIPNVMQILTESFSFLNFSIPSILFTPIISRLMGMTENINVKGGVFNNTFIENEDGIFVIGGTLTLTKNYIEGVWGWSYNLLCIETDLEFIDTHMNTGFIGIIYIDMRLKMIDSSISDIEIGLLSLAGLYLKWYPEDMDWVENSSITLLNSTINNTGVAMIIGPKSLSITDSTISNSGGWWYEGYGFDGMDVWECSVSISDTIISNVNFCSFTNCPTVTVADHSQFTGCAGSLQVTNSVLTVTDSSFDWNDKGISSSQSEIHVRDNIFSNQSYAIYSTESSGEVLNNWVTESRNAGITVVDSSLTIGATNAGNHFRGDTTSIDCQHSSPSIIDNDFSGSGTGISCWDDSSPDIVSNEFHDIATIGIYSSGSSPSIVGNIFKNISREAIKCEDESVLTIINNTMRYTEYGIRSSSSSLLMENNNILYCSKYGIYCSKSSLSITGGVISNNKYGVYAVSSDVIVSEPLISGNSYGAYFEKCLLFISNTTIVNNNLVNDSYGIYLYKCPDPALPGAPVKIINSTILNNSVDLNISDSRIEAVTSTIGIIYLSSSTISSELECIDFTPDFGNITFADNSSKLTVSFYLTVNVTWYNVTSGGLNNTPVDNASIKIYNNVSSIPTNLSTDSNGIVYTKILALKLNKTTKPDGGVSFTPHRVNASKYDITNETEEIWINNETQRYVKLVLYDRELPLIFIDPVFFNPTNNKNLTLTGNASDNIELIKWVVENETGRIMVKVNDGAWINLRDYTFEVVNSTLGNYTVKWSGVVTLNEGDNTVYVMVKDFAWNNGTNTVTDTLGNEKITLDTTAPSLTVSPIPETTNQPTLTITGETDGVNLTINTVSVPIINNTFSMTFNLNEGINVFTITASDALGNEKRVELSIIVFDDTPPTSGIAHIKNYVNTLTSVSGVANDDISGIKKVEICIRNSDGYYWTGSAWSSTETWLNASGTSEWSYPWTPETDGVYTIMSRATDNADNTETPSSGVTFTYDKTPPALTNIKPSNNTETESGTITVSGKTEPGANVTIVTHGYADVDENGYFSATVKLGTGKNTITIIAKDLAGNTNQTTIIIKRISGEWVPPDPAWITGLVGIIVAVLIIVVFVLYKKKIIKLKLHKKKTETEKTGENVLHKEKRGTGKHKENVGFSFKEK